MLYLTIRAIVGVDAFRGSESKSTQEKSGYLIFLLACVVLSIRMLAWPWFYLMLQSFVMEVPGAMCIFGVTQILPSTVKFLQIIKPLSFFIMGGWLLCYFVNKNLPTAPLTRRILFFLLIPCGLLLVDSTADIYYVLCMKPLITVSCCSTVFDVAFRPSAMIPQAIFGANYSNPLLFLYYLINIVLIILLLLSASKKRSSSLFLSRKMFKYILLAVAIINIPIVFISFLEVIGPRLMQLLLHHCIYCFIGNGTVPDAPIIVGLFIIGTFAIGWMFIIKFMCKTTEKEPISSKLLLRINNLSAFCLLSSLIMVTVHLIIV
ncbi:MAG: hypothetical protein P8Y80_06285 [Acidobacteriota bacterium]